MSKVKQSGTATATASAKPATDKAGEEHSGRATRETIESIAVAVILAFLFRAFVAEAFVIPTGSMAPTLQGRHMDVVCSECDSPYRTGASIENDGHGEVLGTTCPICRFPMKLDKERDPNQRSFNGDRILVSKFAYEIGEPKRWDVIVFKYPGNAKQNYIKRLVGLPNETVEIRHGDIYAQVEQDGAEGAEGFQIVRKPPHKLLAMLQVVDDTRYRADELIRVGWPKRWQDWSNPAAPAWHQRSDGGGFETDAADGGEAWMRYRHVVPRIEDWDDILSGRIPRRLADGQVQGQLITDYYAYNDSIEGYRYAKAIGMHWVGDLAVLAKGVEVLGSQGAVLLDLVKGGVHYTCRIDVATGEATLSIDGGQQVFRREDGVEVVNPRGATRIRGPGKYDLRFSNCDDQLLLWVNGRLIEFDGPTTYDPDRHAKPKWSPRDAGDLEPVGFGAEGVAVRVNRLQVLRDVYYVASSFRIEENGRIPAEDDYEGLLYTGSRVDYVTDVFSSPQSWATTGLFDARREDVRFRMGPDEFFPLGDNSPQSRDARVWSQFHHAADPHPPPCVRRDLWTGKA